MGSSLKQHFFLGSCRGRGTGGGDDELLYAWCQLRIYRGKSWVHLTVYTTSQQISGWILWRFCDEFSEDSVMSSHEIPSWVVINISALYLWLWRNITRVVVLPVSCGSRAVSVYILAVVGSRQACENTWWKSVHVDSPLYILTRRF